MDLRTPPHQEQVGLRGCCYRADITALSYPLKTSLICGQLFGSLPFAAKTGFPVDFLTKLVKDPSISWWPLARGLELCGGNRGGW